MNSSPAEREDGSLVARIGEKPVALSVGIRGAPELTYMNVHLGLAMARDTDKMVSMKSSQLASSPYLLWPLLP